MEKKCFCLHDLPVFDDLERSVFALVCSRAAVKRHYRRGETLFCQGDTADTLYLIKEGSFKLTRLTEDGKEVILRVAAAGTVLGEEALFRQGTQHATAIALEGARVCMLSRESLEQVIRANPDLAMQVINSLGNSLYNSWENSTKLRTGSSEERILNLFIRLAADHGEPCSGGTKICLTLTQQEIADFVGLSRVTAAQVIKKLSERKYLVRNGKYYILKDRCF